MAPTESPARLAPAGWVKCTARATRDLDGMSPSRSFPNRSPRTRHVFRFEQGGARRRGALAPERPPAIFDIGTGELPFLVTGLPIGETLRSRLARGSMPPTQIVTLALQLVAGLAAAHARGVVHRDLKPDNIFLTRDGGLKILDFGLAKHQTGGAAGPAATMAVRTSAGMILCTVGYMAPEQVRGDVAHFALRPVRGRHDSL